jgi:hypothetical protein
MFGAFNQHVAMSGGPFSLAPVNPMAATVRPTAVAAPSVPVVHPLAMLGAHPQPRMPMPIAQAYLGEAGVAMPMASQMTGGQPPAAMPVMLNHGNLGMPQGHAPWSAPSAPATSTGGKPPSHPAAVADSIAHWITRLQASHGNYSKAVVRTVDVINDKLAHNEAPHGEIEKALSQTLGLSVSIGRHESRMLNAVQDGDFDPLVKDGLSIMVYRTFDNLRQNYRDLRFELQTARDVGVGPITAHEKMADALHETTQSLNYVVGELRDMPPLHVDLFGL